MKQLPRSRHLCLFSWSCAVLLCQLFLHSCGGDGAGRPLGKIPPFEVQRLDGPVMTAKDIPAGKPSIFIYFRSDCDHCLEEINELSAEGGLLKDCMIVLVSEEELDTLKKFAEGSGLAKFPFIHITRDVDEKWKKSFHPVGTPAIFVYDRNRNFVKQFRGKATVKELRKLVSGN